MMALHQLTRRDPELTGSVGVQAEEANAQLVASTLATNQEQQNAMLQESLGASNTQCEHVHPDATKQMYSCWHDC